MSRVILTFPNLFQVLAADNVLNGRVQFRPTPTPPGLSADLCGMSIELLDLEEQEDALRFLSEAKIEPLGVHVLEF
jgi:hypothetical protein